MGEIASAKQHLFFTKQIIGMLLFFLRIVGHLSMVIVVGDLHTNHNQIVTGQIDEGFFLLLELDYNSY